VFGGSAACKNTSALLVRSCCTPLTLLLLPVAAAATRCAVVANVHTYVSVCALFVFDLRPVKWLQQLLGRAAPVAAAVVTFVAMHTSFAST
jgi:hypothetical protein